MMDGGMAQLAALLITGLKCSEPRVETSLCEPANNNAGDSFYRLLLRKMNEGGIVGELPHKLSELLVSMEKSSAENGIFSPRISNDNGGNAPAEYLFPCLLPENIDFAEPQLFPAQKASAVAVEELEDAAIRLVSPERIFTPETTESAGTKITDMIETSSLIKASHVAATSSTTKDSSATLISSAAAASSSATTSTAATVSSVATASSTAAASSSATASPAAAASSLPANPSSFSPHDKLLEAQLFSPKDRPEVLPTARPGIMVPVLTESLESGMSDSALKNHSAADNPLSIIPPVEGTQQHTPVAPVQPVPVLDMDVLVDQLVQGVRIAHTTDGTEMHVQLKPEFLGKLSIKICSDIHGLHMEIKAENEAVRQIMQDTLPNLQQRLAEKGITLNNLTLLADPNLTGRRRPEKALIQNPSGTNFRQESKVASVPEAKMPARLSLIDYFA
jgi:flagellar hook-length control protein FliK